MPARCHNDTCTVHWSEVNTPSPAYQADVQLNPASLACVDGSGIGVLLSPNAGNILSNPGNGIFADLPDAIVTDLSGNPANKGVSPSADQSSPQSSDTYSWTNTTGRDVTLLVSGEFNFDYGILGPEHAYSYSAGNGQRAGRFASAAFDPLGVGDPANPISPFNAQIAMRLLANIGAPPTTAQKACRVDIGGTIFVSVTTSAERKVTRVPFFWMVRVAAGQTLNMKSDMFYQGPSQTVNVVATPGAGTGLAGTGHELWNLQVAAIPI